MDADQPIAALESLDKMVEERAAGFVFISRALGIVGVIALVLSVIGIYSLMAFLNTQRTQEIGVRMALGAGRAMESVLFGLVSTSFVQLGALVVILGSVALVASYVPARRAARIDPMAALRQP